MARPSRIFTEFLTSSQAPMNLLCQNDAVDCCGEMTRTPTSMTTHLYLLSHASTTALRRASFPLDEALDPDGVYRASRCKLPTGTVKSVWSCPSARATQTARALGYTPVLDPMLGDLDVGRWRGRTLDEVGTTEPGPLEQWLIDPQARPHGGESIDDLLARVAGWLALPTHHDVSCSLAVTHPAVMRAALIKVLKAPPHSFWSIDVPPLTSLRLDGSGGDRWRLRLTR